MSKNLGKSTTTPLYLDHSDLVERVKAIDSNDPELDSKLSQIRTEAQRRFDQAKEITSQLVASVVSTASAVKNSVVDNLPHVNAETQTNEVTSPTPLNSLENTMEALKLKVEHKASDVAGAVEEGVNRAEHTIASTTRSLEGKAHDLAENTQEAVDHAKHSAQANDKSLGEKVVDVVQETVDQAKHSVQQAERSLEGKVADATEAVEETVDQAKHSVQHAERSLEEQ